MNIKCFFGFHAYEILEEENIGGSSEAGLTTSNTPCCEWAVGGVDYHVKCQRCGKKFTIECRGVWSYPKYPKSVDFKKLE